MRHTFIYSNFRHGFLEEFIHFADVVIKRIARRNFRTVTNRLKMENEIHCFFFDDAFLFLEKQEPFILGRNICPHENMH